MRIPRGPVTDALVLINLALWAVLWLTGYENDAIDAFGFFPAMIGPAAQSGDVGQMIMAAIVRPITAAFLHGDVFHVAFNMMMLLLTGRFVESVLGGRLFAVLYGVSALSAALAQYLAGPNDPSVMIGSSGAGAGIIATYMLIYANKGATAWGAIPAFWARRLQLLALWVIINLAIGFVSGGGAGVAIFAHIGGFVAGLFLTSPLLERRFKQR